MRFGLLRLPQQREREQYADLDGAYLIEAPARYRCANSRCCVSVASCGVLLNRPATRPPPGDLKAAPAAVKPVSSSTRGQEREEPLRARLPQRPIRRGDVLRVIGGSGGGWGNPDHRDPALVTGDRLEGYTT